MTVKDIAKAANVSGTKNFIILHNEPFVENFRSMTDGGVDGIVCQDADTAWSVYSAAGKEIRRTLRICSIDILRLVLCGNT